MQCRAVTCVLRCSFKIHNPEYARRLYRMSICNHNIIYISSRPYDTIFQKVINSCFYKKIPSFSVITMVSNDNGEKLFLVLSGDSAVYSLQTSSKHTLFSVNALSSNIQACVPIEQVYIKVVPFLKIKDRSFCYMRGSFRTTVTKCI